ncbi:MAG: glycerophosphodiester phosphodiesterase [Kangiellaceae bacterium]|nr:glycerophosphodiester phosphodiesterase [Kangiellaceae bacterium]
MNLNKFYQLVSCIILAILSVGCAGISNQTTIAGPTAKGETMNQPIESQIVIAHRGASGYAPEHSLVAKAIAHTMGVDFIEQDVVMTKDNHLVVLHDPFLDRVTNVMELFPKRSRKINDEARWLAIDFTLAEIKSLDMTEGFKLDPKTQSKFSPYPLRFPLFKSSFRVSTLQEEIELIQGLNHSTGKDIGIYVEVKAPWLHRREGKDISKATLSVLKKYGYENKSDKVFFQCFDPEELKRVKQDLLTELSMDIKLVQLIAETSWNETMIESDGQLVPYNYDWMFEAGGMKEVSKYADGIGPWMPMLVSRDSAPARLTESKLLQSARDNSLLVHPYTVRKEAAQIPPFAKDFNHLLEILLNDLKVDGVFSDHPDLVLDFINDRER